MRRTDVSLRDGNCGERQLEWMQRPMKRLRRMAGLLTALLLGFVAWFTVVISFPTSGELRLSRELGSGALRARVPSARPRFFGMIEFGGPQFSSVYRQPGTGISGPLPWGTILVHSVKGGEEVWEIKLGARDKSWELEVKESRSVRLKIGERRWRLGTKTRLWRTDRTGQGREDAEKKWEREG